MKKLIILVVITSAMLSTLTIQPVFAGSKKLVTKKAGTTYWAQTESGYQAKLLSALLEASAEESTPYDLFANFELAIVKDQLGEFILVQVTCDLQNPTTPTYTAGAEKEFGQVVRTINYMKRLCLIRQ